ncbi:glutamate formiminotransferase [Aquihabitans daechungensis]|uniref:glutamate formiminotransferase n=1 Tax=Aquihabitans daechungensis TaxID=1052257 RepID=UPI003B9E2249
MLECVVNISEGRDRNVIDAIARKAGADLLDVHTDADHHRSVLTLVGEAAPRAVAREAVARLDLTSHRGAHPRIGVVDVVPFVPLDGSSTADALAARDAFGAWAAAELGVPSFRYGPERTLPDVRRGAFTTLKPDDGPAEPHPTAGAIAVGTRPVLVAYNVWLAEPDLARAKQLAASIRSSSVRALGLRVGDEVQVSMNLIDPVVVGPGAVVDAIAARAAVRRCELVGLVPRQVLEAEDAARWDELDLGPDRTIEARLP